MAPRDEAGALRQLADQPDGERGGHLADHPRAAGHGVAKLYGRADRCERGVPAQFREEDPADHPRSPAAQGARAGLEPKAAAGRITLSCDRARGLAEYEAGIRMTKKYDALIIG